jgi:hypothetical protein
MQKTCPGGRLRRSPRDAPRLLLATALRAWALVATAAGARLADHGSILLRRSPAGSAATCFATALAAVAAAIPTPAFAALPNRDGGDEERGGVVHPPEPEQCIRAETD